MFAQFFGHFVKVARAVGVPGAVSRALAVPAESGFFVARLCLMIEAAAFGTDLAFAFLMMPDVEAVPTLPRAAVDSEE